MRSTCLTSLFEKQGCKRVCLCKYVRKNPYVFTYLYANYLSMNINEYVYVCDIYNYVYIYIYHNIGSAYAYVYIICHLLYLKKGEYARSSIILFNTYVIRIMYADTCIVIIYIYICKGVMPIPSLLKCRG